MSFVRCDSPYEVTRKPSTSSIVETQNSSVFATYVVTATILCLLPSFTSSASQQYMLMCFSKNIRMIKKVENHTNI